MTDQKNRNDSPLELLNKLERKNHENGYVTITLTERKALRAALEAQAEESAWLRLDECEIQTADGFGGWDRLTPLRGERHLMALVYSIAKGDPASVRVRKKR